MNAADVRAEAEELHSRLRRQVSDCWERGAHPATTPLSLRNGADLALVVARLAMLAEGQA